MRASVLSAFPLTVAFIFSYADAATTPIIPAEPVRPAYVAPVTPPTSLPESAQRERRRRRYSAEVLVKSDAPPTGARYECSVNLPTVGGGSALQRSVVEVISPQELRLSMSGLITASGIVPFEPVPEKPGFMKYRMPVELEGVLKNWMTKLLENRYDASDDQVVVKVKPFIFPSIAMVHARVL